MLLIDGVGREERDYVWMSQAAQQGKDVTFPVKLNLAPIIVLSLDQFPNDDNLSSEVKGRQLQNIRGLKQGHSIPHPPFEGIDLDTQLVTSSHVPHRSHLHLDF